MISSRQKNKKQNFLVLVLLSELVGIFSVQFMFSVRMRKFLGLAIGDLGWRIGEKMGTTPNWLFHHELVISTFSILVFLEPNSCVHLCTNLFNFTEVYTYMCSWLMY